MRTLYHLWLSPYSRKVRIVLHEKKLDFEMRVENVWERRDAFLVLNPAGDVPVLVESDNTAISGSDVISEFLEDIQPETTLIGSHPMGRAEVRRMVAWFDRKFNREVTENLVGEKVMKKFLGLGEPNAQIIRTGFANLPIHLDYMTYLLERRKWLAGDQFSLADITAAAHISAVDYLDDIPWEDYSEVKDWYSRIKSRPSFRPILDDRITGIRPPKHYSDLDF
jgi:glutathione S-transferase